MSGEVDRFGDDWVTRLRLETPKRRKAEIDRVRAEILSQDWGRSIVGGKALSLLDQLLAELNGRDPQSLT